MTDLNTHGYTMPNGKHIGQLITRVPISYLKWMVCNRHTASAYAKAELDRRGTTTPELDISGHAIDRASQCLLEHWQKYRNGEEGLHGWLCRVSAEALQVGTGDKVSYMGIKFVFERDGEWPVLKTVMRGSNEHTGR